VFLDSFICCGARHVSPAMFCDKLLVVSTAGCMQHTHNICRACSGTPRMDG
jgi:hypothetical protein